MLRLHISLLFSWMWNLKWNANVHFSLLERFRRKNHLVRVKKILWLENVHVSRSSWFSWLKCSQVVWRLAFTTPPPPPPPNKKKSLHVLPHAIFFYNIEKTSIFWIFQMSLGLIAACMQLFDKQTWRSYFLRRLPACQFGSISGLKREEMAS